jgi:predicted GH43/DUF377 family glycosyl hydrolase
LDILKNYDVDKYLTPQKYGKEVLAASGTKDAFDRNAVDSPFVFYHNNRFYMLYVGFDGKGYQSALATSNDLLNWKHQSMIFTRNDRPGWDFVGAAGTWIIKNDHLFELPTLKKIDGKYWMVYHAYPNAGYEAGPAEIGLAWSDDEELLKWRRFEKPVLSWRDGAEWEKSGLYKAGIVMKDETYYMFYNAKNSNVWPWYEQIGVAVSSDLLNWKRYEANPVIKVTKGAWDSNFVADPYVVRDDALWVMYYYGYNGKNAREGIAFSKDLFNWEKYKEPIITNGKAGEIDEIHAHKPAVVYFQNKLYHYYCAVRNHKTGDLGGNIDPTGNNPDEFRCISVALS